MVTGQLNRSFLPHGISCLLMLVMASGVMCVNLGFISSVCNTKTIPPNTSFETNLRVILDEMERVTPFSQYDYKTHRTDGGTSAYGEAICNADLQVEECSDCLGYLKVHIWDFCSRAVGAKVQLASCFMHYEAYKF